MKKLSYLLLFLFFSVSLLHAVDIKSVVAYPVPFDPRKGTLTIDYPDSGGSVVPGNNVKVTVFDINGDTVTVVNGIIWNGRRSNGEYVKPGLYILKVEISDKDGGYWKKLIRILVKY